jgi:hypothetical protein
MDTQFCYGRNPMAISILQAHGIYRTRLWQIAPDAHLHGRNGKSSQGQDKIDPGLCFLPEIHLDLIYCAIDGTSCIRGWNVSPPMGIRSANDRIYLDRLSNKSIENLGPGAQHDSLDTFYILDGCAILRPLGPALPEENGNPDIYQPIAAFGNHGIDCSF